MEKMSSVFFVSVVALEVNWSGSANFAFIC